MATGLLPRSHGGNWLMIASLAYRRKFVGIENASIDHLAVGLPGTAMICQTA